MPGQARPSILPPGARGRLARVFLAGCGTWAVLGGCSEGPQAAAAAPVEAAAITLSVEGMVCGGCEQTIEQAVTKLPGVISCVADHEAKTARVRFDAAQIARADIARTITRLGYTVR